MGAIAELRRLSAEGLKGYGANTPPELKILDCFLLYFLLVGAVQVVYIVGAGSYPFNAFLASFFSCLGMFVLTVALRMQLNSANKVAFENFNSNKPISKGRAILEWLFSAVVLHLAVFNYIG